MKTAHPAAVLCMLSLFTAVGAAQDEEGPFTLELGSWVCSTPETYDQAVAEQQQGTNLLELQKRLFDQQICIYMDDDHLEDMMAPFVKVLDRQGDKAKVMFIVEHYKRIATLHRKFTRMSYTGWTEANNVKPYYE